MSTTSVKILNGALDEIPIPGNGTEIILRGVIDADSLRLLQVGDYQREVMPLSSLDSLVKAMKKGVTVPDIELGMRGQRYRETQDGFWWLLDDVYIVDGLQRVSSGLHILQSGGEVRPHIGAAIHFGTNEVWERERFQILNADRRKLSPNVLLRNLRHTNQAIDVLFRLTTKDKGFVLHDRVSWTQAQRRTELINALTMAKAVGVLHGHIGPGRGSRYDDLAAGLEKIMGNVGSGVFRDNVRYFFDLIDELWGVKRVVYKQGAVQMRLTFLQALASVLSGHLDFWKEERLFVSADMKRKLAGFSLSDPNVIQLAGSGGTSRDMLSYLLIRHINSGRRTGHIKPRNVEALPTLTDEEVEAIESGESAA